jgi:hypothetical protein
VVATSDRAVPCQPLRSDRPGSIAGAAPQLAALDREGKPPRTFNTLTRKTLRSDAQPWQPGKAAHPPSQGGPTSKLGGATG